jgi:hypothetical protein
MLLGSPLLHLLSSFSIYFPEGRERGSEAWRERANSSRIHPRHPRCLLVSFKKPANP